MYFYYFYLIKCAVLCAVPCAVTCVAAMPQTPCGRAFACAVRCAVGCDVSRAAPGPAACAKTRVGSVGQGAKTRVGGVGQGAKTRVGWGPGAGGARWLAVAAGRVRVQAHWRAAVLAAAA